MVWANIILIPSRTVKESCKSSLINLCKLIVSVIHPSSNPDNGVNDLFF